MPLGGYSYGLAWLPLYFQAMSVVPGQDGSIPGMGGGGGLGGGRGGNGYNGQMIIEFYAG